jgi:hypothetical protein
VQPPPNSYRSLRAWRLAGIYLLLLVAVSTLAGTPQGLMRQPIATAAQLGNPRWWALLLACVLLTLEVYGRYWPRHTLRFGRPLRPMAQAGFGLAWGLALGLWMLTLVGWARHWLPGGGAAGLPALLLAFTLISLWQALAQSYFWGVYVTPEHDTPASNRSKVWRCHVPFLASGLLFLGAYGNGALFMGLQVLCLVITSLAMRMPPWWDRTPQRPVTTRPGLLGLPRTHGWQGHHPSG